MSHEPWAMDRKTAVLLLLPAILLSISLNAPFVFDDLPAVAQNVSILDFSSVARSWLSPESRPAVSTQHAIEFLLWKGWPAGFRAVNAAFHLACAFLLYALLRKGVEKSRPVPGGASIPFWTALLFAIHPVTLAAAATVSARSELSAAFFFLLALWRTVRWTESRAASDGWIALACLLLSAASKPAAMGLGVCAAWGILAAGSPRWRLPLVLSLAASLFLLFWPSFLSMARAAAPTDYWGSQTRALPYYLRILIVPHALRLDHDRHAWDPGEGDVWPAGAAMILALAALAWLGRSRTPALAWAILWVLVSFLPTSAAPLLDTVVEYRAYLAAAGAAFLLAQWGARAGPAAGRWMTCVAALFAIGSAAVLTVRREPLCLHADNARRNPESTRVMSGAAQWFRGRGDLLRAKTAYRASLKLEAGESPASLSALSRTHAPILADLGVTLVLLGDIGGAIPAFQQAYRTDPSEPAALLTLAGLFLKRGEFPAARQHIQAYLSARPRDAAALNLLAAIHRRAGEADDAAGVWRYVQTLYPGDPVSAHNLGNSSLAAGDARGAVALYGAALSRDCLREQDIPTLRNMLLAYRKLGDEKATERIQEMLKSVGVPEADRSVPAEPIWK